MGVYGKVKAFYRKYIARYRPDLLVPCGIGVIMCYFGGEFALVISALEAYRMCGWEESKQSIFMLLCDIDRVIDKSEEDDLIDADGDGIPDVEQITPNQLLERKSLIVLQNIDYQRVTSSINGLNAGFMAAVATLKVKYCKSLTLGSSIGDIVVPVLMKTVVPLLNYAVSRRYQPWVPVIVNTGVKFLIVRFAYLEHRVLSAFHCALRGGLLFSRGLLDYFSTLKIVKIKHEDTYVDEVVGYALAASGLWFQIKYGFRLPFPLNVFLFPVSMVENYILTNIATDMRSSVQGSGLFF